MAQVRRTEYLFVYCEDRDSLDIPALLRGQARVVPHRQLLAMALLTGEEVALSEEALRALFALPSDRWVEAAGAEVDPKLVSAGLVLSDGPGERESELRRRDERLASDAWNVYAALFHFMTKWRDLDFSAVPAEAPEVDEPGHGLTSEWVRRFGAPPPHFQAISERLDVVELPVEEQDGQLYDLLARRRTTRAFDAEGRVTAGQLGVLLRWTFGAHGTLDAGDGVVALRKTSPSGGALHPTEVYPLVARVEGIEPGIYHYGVERHELELLEPLGDDDVAALADEFSCGQGFPRAAAVTFVLTTRFYRSFWKYRRHKRAYGVLLLDAGHLSQTFYLLCAELGLGAFVTAAVNGANMEERLGLDPYAEGALALCGCGLPAADPGGADPDFAPYVPPRDGAG